MHENTQDPAAKAVEPNCTERVEAPGMHQEATVEEKVGKRKPKAIWYAVGGIAATLAVGFLVWAVTGRTSTR